MTHREGAGARSMTRPTSIAGREPMTARLFVRAVFCAAAVLVAVSVTGMAQGRPAAGQPAPTMKTEMRAKLTNAQALLEAVVRTDYEGIDRAASRLSRISEMEIASWQTRPAPPQYTEQAVEFLTAVQALREASQARDITRAGDAYAGLTLACITCHRFVRDAGIRPR